MVLDDGFFLACESTVTHKTVMRSNLSSAVAGGEGLFNLGLSGSGIVALESPLPEGGAHRDHPGREDTLKFDGNMAGGLVRQPGVHR